MIKQVIVMRTDLNMRKGKMCAQAAHASMKVFFDHMVRDTAHPGASQDVYCLEAPPEMVEWIEGAFTKVVVGIDSGEALVRLAERVKGAGLPHALIEDNGATEFHGVKTVTCLAIGPAPAEAIDVFTRELKLL